MVFTRDMNTETTFVKNLNANERFTLPGQNTVYVCDHRRTEGGLTTVVYHIGSPTALNTFTFTKPSLSTIYREV